MYFIGYRDSGVAADVAFQRLEENGIPSFLGAATRGDPRRAIFVLIEDQVEDAKRLLEDEEHVVVNTIDMAHFEAFEETFDASSWLIRRLLVMLAVVAAVLCLTVYLVLPG